jgi:actin beta/gamma 1
MKAGFSGDNAPRSVFPTIVHHVRPKKQLYGMTQYPGAYTRDEIYYYSNIKTSIITKHYLIKYGMIDENQWNNMEKI